MKIRFHPDRQRWAVHYKDNAVGNRKPYSTRFFKTETAAKQFAASVDREARELGEAWTALGAGDRATLIEAHRMAARAGVSIVDAIRRSGRNARAITLGELRDAVLKSKEGKGVRPRTLSSLRLTLGSFCRGREDKPAEDVTPETVTEWIANPMWSPVRRRGALVELGTMFNHGVRTGALNRNPCAAVERPMVESRPTSIFTPAQTERLFRVTADQDPDLLGFLALAAFGGFRTESEVGRMTLADVKGALASGVIRPPVENKTRRQRIVPLLPNLRAWLESWVRRGVEVIPPNFRKRWESVRKAACLLPWPQNVLRHSRASYRLADTGDERLTAAEDGHTPDVLVRHYRALVTPEAARDYFAIFPSRTKEPKTP